VEKQLISQRATLIDIVCCEVGVGVGGEAKVLNKMPIFIVIYGKLRFQELSISNRVYGKIKILRSSIFISFYGNVRILRKRSTFSNC
jgi:hypothetical protein